MLASVISSSKTCSGCGATRAKLPLSERTFRCEDCGLVLDRDENARTLAALAHTAVAGSGSETLNARPRPRPGVVPRTHVRPGPAGQRVGREPGSPNPEHQTGTAPEQSEAA